MQVSVPLKLSVQGDMIRPLQDYLKKSYSKEVAKQQMPSCEFVNQTRTTAVAALSRPDTCRDVLCKYLAVLRILEAKLPGLNFSNRWNDVFENKKFHDSNDVSYEKICVMFNIAGSLTAECTPIQKTEAAQKSAIANFKLAAGWYEKIRVTLKTALFNPHQIDLTDLNLIVLNRLCLAQAQEIFLMIAINKGLKDESISKLAQLCANLYSSCIDCLIKAQSPKVDKGLLGRLQVGQYLCTALAQEYFSKLRQSELKYGDEIAHLRVALENLDAAIRTIEKGPIVPGKESSEGGFAGLISGLVGGGGGSGWQSDSLFKMNLVDAKTVLIAHRERIFKRERQITDENARAYYLTITIKELLPKLPAHTAPMAATPDKELDALSRVPSSSEQGSQGPSLETIPFSDLVPMELVRYSQLFVDDTTRIVRECYDEEEATKKETRGEIERLDMPKSVDMVRKSTGPLQQSVLSGCLAVKNEGGWQLLQKNSATVNGQREGCSRQLLDIRSKLSQLVGRVGYTQQGKVLEGYLTEVTQYDDSLTQARKIDDEVAMKMSMHSEVIQTISYTCNGNEEGEAKMKELSDKLLSALMSSGASSSSSSSSSSSVPTAEGAAKLVADASALQDGLNAFQARENKQQQALDALREGVSSVDITKILIANAGEKPAQSVVESEKQKIMALAEGAKKAFADTKGLMPTLLELHTKLTQDLSSNSYITGRVDCCTRLEAAAAAFTMIKEHLKKGAEFYASLASRLTEFMQRIAVLEGQIAPSKPTVIPQTPLAPPSQPQQQTFTFQAPPMIGGARPSGSTQTFAPPPPPSGRYS
ncbi:Vacuolar protein sorting 31 (Vps31) [Monocercomonoides exilis]|uniref:Vacuolar protein sorting 31 (Vps31) n=1 Tax=Monocercomonoides exilis TaxID=2049356 RepID=UPI00355AC774|nr:Vacuolar protein sorting 31 (Vps31) [Monocercomonoides exilis]|eukprot:MONOS_1330.1-p1 / transcript=MONOS_1330.1 / gene=MONOS_1330 / organism=Monocercomonoides_exilis_PA203 / gene_product= Vacuolar protein sorting 31 (Vps31) / transcript_product= Vacuolar protein sorting 31 (Vps31) / location=Mono_scaffold00023:18388-21513(+) / protein_length=817 / sequence_SO=supercontig / SO=protein_coding / is_pseudo=false